MTIQTFSGYTWKKKLISSIQTWSKNMNRGTTRLPESIKWVKKWNESCSEPSLLATLALVLVNTGWIKNKVKLSVGRDLFCLAHYTGPAGSFQIPEHPLSERDQALQHPVDMKENPFFSLLLCLSLSEGIPLSLSFSVSLWLHVASSWVSAERQVAWLERRAHWNEPRCQRGHRASWHKRSWLSDRQDALAHMCTHTYTQTHTRQHTATGLLRSRSKMYSLLRNAAQTQARVLTRTECVNRCHLWRMCTERLPYVTEKARLCVSVGSSSFCFSGKGHGGD